MHSKNETEGSRTIVLIHPCTTTRWTVQPWCDLPLELICIGSPLVRSGYRVKIIDQRVDSDWRETLIAELTKKPICVGVTSTTGPQLKHALQVSRIVKKHSNIPVVWGGIHATLLPEQTLEKSDIDYVVQGEGERTFEELVAALENNRKVKNIAGVCYKDGGQILKNSPRPFINLNEEPFLAYDLVDVQKYTRTVFGVQRLSFSTSRGCSFSCAFCYSTIIHKRQFRALSADVALEHIKEFTSRYGVRGLFPTDANFFLDLDRARNILEGVLRENLNVVFTRLHIRFDTLRKLTDDDLELFKKAGVRCLALGVESGSVRIREMLHKQIDEEELHMINYRLKRFSIMPMYFFMIGFPTETLSELKATVNLFMKLADDNPEAYVSINVYTPFPGTELFSVAIEEGLTVPNSLEDWFSFSYRNLGANGTWLPESMQKTVAMLDFCSFFASKRGYVTPFKKTNPFATTAARIYAPIARLRMKHLFNFAPIEIKVAEKLGLYGNVK